MNDAPVLPPWLQHPIAIPDGAAEAAARARQGQLTKPPGALGRLEGLAERLAALQGRERPRVDRVHVVVFAGDHGIAAAGVSAFPQEVTIAMLHNFTAGGAAISVLARHLGAKLEVVDVGSARDPGPIPGVLSQRVASGTADFRHAPAMTPQQLAEALTVGHAAAQRAAQAGGELFIGGEMGIGNSSAATALACALLERRAQQLTGPGTGLDAAGVERKADAIQTGLDHHGAAVRTPMAALQRLGGLEIAALVGAFIGCGQEGIAVLVDGFIATAAALAAVTLRPELRPWLLFSHRSAEPGHRALLEALAADPLLDLGMRLGEGSGAAVAVGVLRAACALHGEMATFAEAAVPEKTG